MTQTHYCYAFLPDDENYVWVRELSCAGCSACANADYRKCFPISGSPGCLNSDVCGKWRRYPILKNGEKDPRKQVQHGAYDGKNGFVIKFVFVDYQKNCKSIKDFAYQISFVQIQKCFRQILLSVK